MSNQINHKEKSRKSWNAVKAIEDALNKLDHVPDDQTNLDTRLTNAYYKLFDLKKELAEISNEYAEFHHKNK